MTERLDDFQQNGQRFKRSGSSSDQAFSRDESPNHSRHGRVLHRDNSRDSVLDDRQQGHRDQPEDLGDGDDSPGRYGEGEVGRKRETDRQREKERGDGLTERERQTDRQNPERERGRSGGRETEREREGGGDGLTDRHRKRERQTEPSVLDDRQQGHVTSRRTWGMGMTHLAGMERGERGGGTEEE